MAVAKDLPEVVGRDSELEELLATLRRAREGAGTARFITGELGAGKQALITELERRVQDEPSLADGFFAKAVCSREHGGESAYEPFAWLLLDLIEKTREKKRWNAIFGAVKDVAPDWLGMVPIAGPAISAGVKTALRAQELYAGEAAEEQARRAQSRYLQFVDALDARLDMAPFVVLVLRQAEWIDGASANLLDRIARLAQEKPLVILVTYRAADVGEGHPLRTVERGLRIDGLADEPMLLTGLDAAATEQLVMGSRGLRLAPNVAEWLVSYTEGNPFFITELLPVLESRGLIVERDGVYGLHDDAHLESGTLRLTGTLSERDIPVGIAAVLDERIERLDEPLRNLLAIAAVEGPEFLTTTLRSVADTEEAELLRRLGEAEKQHQVIRYAKALQQQLFLYRFTHLLLHQRLYEQLSVPLRAMYHAKVGDALVQVWGENAARPLLLEIAGHYEAAHDFATAGRFLLKSAESAALDGASLEAASLARRALRLITEGAPSRQDAATEALRADLIAILVGTQWENVHAGDTELKALIEQGKKAAERSGDPALQARLLHAYARYVLGTLDVDAAISTLNDARELARTAGDALSELAVMIDLGNTLAIHGVQDGLAVLNDALALYKSKVATPEEPNTELERLRWRLVAFIGIGEFDSGDLGAAQRRLDESIRGLDAIRRSDDLPRILNYRAQIALAMGDFEKAESSLRRALEAQAGSGGPWMSYNTALLGKIFTDAGRFEAAQDPLRKAWALAETEWQVRLGTAVRQYLVEFLLRPGSSDPELEEAASHIGDQIADAESSGFKNMLAGAHSLAAELALRRDDPGEALRNSAAAVAILDAARDLPIVRTEEVLWRHARCLAAAGERGASAYREKARAVIERKADSLGDDEDARNRLFRANPVARSLYADRGA